MVLPFYRWHASASGASLLTYTLTWPVSLVRASRALLPGEFVSALMSLE